MRSSPPALTAVSAAAFSFSGLVLQTRNAPPITGVVAKSADDAVTTSGLMRGGPTLTSCRRYSP